MKYIPLLLLCLVIPIGLSAQIPARVANTTLQFPSEIFGTDAYRMTDINPGEIGHPVDLASPPGDSRLFVVDRLGIIYVIPDLDNPVPEIFLDLRDRVENDNGEEGLLSLAFHPDYASNGFFYVFYTATTADPLSVHDDRLSRFSRSTTNVNRGDPASELIMISQPGDQWGQNHNAGDIAFGPDGYLYVAMGDDGNRSTAQKIDRGFFSAILRIQVGSPPGGLAPNPHPSSRGGYVIPPDNPFIGATSFNGQAVDPAEVRTEFYAVGLRNPWRMSVDSVTGEIIVGDVGAGDYEEVNYIVPGGNYGWPFREGPDPELGTPPAGVTFVEPIHAYGRDAGISVIGGFIYRGSRLPELNGVYFFSDWRDSEMRGLIPDGTNPVPYQVYATGIPGFGPASLGEDPRNGDLLLADNSWAKTIRRLERNPNANPPALPATLADTGAFSDLATLTPEAGIFSYQINVPFWSDYAIKSRWFSVPDTNLVYGFETETPWDFPMGSVWIKHFDIDMVEGNPATRRRLETRFLIKSLNSVYGVTYRWTSPTTTELVPSEGVNETLARTINGNPVAQVWRYPSRQECLTCHTRDGGYSLGFNTAQLNCEMVYGIETVNQLSALDAMGYLDASPPAVNALPALASADDPSVSLRYRVRSYLQTNCAQCHTGSGIANWDARLALPFHQTQIIDGPLNRNMGDAANRVLVRGDTAHSMLLTRIATRGPGQMPPLGSTMVDPHGTALLAAYIGESINYQSFAESTAPQQISLDGDEDGDGLSNYAEWLLKLSPFLASEKWGIDAMAISPAGPAIQFNRIADNGFLVEYTDTPSDPESWRPLPQPENVPHVPAVTETATITDRGSPPGDRKYRVRVHDR